MTSEADRFMAAQFEVTEEEMASIGQILETILEGKNLYEGPTIVKTYILDNEIKITMAIAMAYMTGALVSKIMYGKE